MGVKFGCKVKVRNRYKRINTIIKKLPTIIEENIEDILENIKVEAIRLKRGNNDLGIIWEIIDVSKKEVRGRVYTDKEDMPYAMFEHFGTGDYRELAPVGKTKRFLETGGSQWFIPVNKVEKPLGYPIIELYGLQFYIAHGVKANHFMTDAEFKTRNENLNIVRNGLEEMFKGVCK